MKFQKGDFEFEMDEGMFIFALVIIALMVSIACVAATEIAALFVR